MPDAHRHGFSAATTADMLADRIAELCATLLPQGRRAGMEWRVGSIFGEPGRSLAVRLVGNRRGVWADFATGESGNALDLVRATRCLSTSQAIAWATAWLGFAPDAPPAGRLRPRPRAWSPETDLDKVARVRLARRWWSETRELEGSIGEQYFRNARGIGAELGDDVRLHPGLAYTEADGTRTTLPAVLCAVRQASGQITGVWRIFLKEIDGRVDRVARLGLGDVAGGAVRLTDADTELYLAEGVESTAALLDMKPGIAAWATLAASMMHKVELPAAVHSVVLVEENDRPDRRGRRASPDAVAALHVCLLAEGRRVRVVRPPCFAKDMNDVLLLERQQQDGWAA